MKIEYDRHADAMYIRLRACPHDVRKQDNK